MENANRKNVAAHNAASLFGGMYEFLMFEYWPRNTKLRFTMQSSGCAIANLSIDPVFLGFQIGIYNHIYLSFWCRVI